MAAVRAEAARRLRFLLPALLGVLALLAVSAPLIDAPAAAETPGYATLELTEVTPTTVTSASGPTVTVAGRVTNTFDRPLSEVQVRLQLGDRVGTAVGLRTSLMTTSAGFPAASPYRPVTDELGNGKTVEFRIEVPISGANSLGIGAAGVYPLLVNVTGTPEYGGPVQITSARTLLPVLSLPADRQRAQAFAQRDPEDGDPLLSRDGSIAANSSDPAAFTFIWPLAAAPQWMPGSLGGGTEEVRLTSDQLAQSLRSDGRLGAQLEVLTALSAMDQAAGDEPDGQTPDSTDEQAPPAGDSPDLKVRDGTCVAVDPDLLVTVQAMTRGYRVMKKPDDPRSGTVAGNGREAAAEWLDRLRTVARSMCITALPYAQAGLNSLKLIDDGELSADAVRDPADLVDSILGVTSLRGLTIPAIGTLSTEGRDLLTGLGLNAAAVASSSLEAQDSTISGRYRSGELTLQTYQAPITAALGGAGSRPVVPAIMPSWQQPQLDTESPVSRRQSALAAMSYPMLSIGSEIADRSDADDEAISSGPLTGRSAFLMPPTYWSPTVDDAQALLDTASLLIASGVAEELPLARLVDDLQYSRDRATLVTPGDVEPVVAQGFPVSTEQAEKARADLLLSWQLQSSLVDDNDTVTTPEQYLTPLRQDLLRAIATPDTTALDAVRSARSLRLGTVTTTLTGMKNAVGILDPGGRYTLASERSPLLLIVRNDLALPIRVRLDIAAPDSLDVGDMGVMEIPPKGTRQLQIPTRASSSERATVRISLVTSTGVPLSEPIELEIYSNAYGKALFWITIAAGIILVLLTARRLWHRFRGEPDPADEDRPEPDPSDLLLAGAPYEERLEVAREEEESRGDEAHHDAGPAGAAERRDSEEGEKP